MIVGTAGHIDHGKTSLVAALTGVDTDRLPEEKRRGISIELGYAYLAQDDGPVLGFIDVPGHEKLVHTMLAGATGIDHALLVVAADDGVMPQTREHLAILSLLGVSSGLVAITKCDRVEAARVVEVEAEVRALIDGSPLADAPLHRVSAVARTGIDELREALLALASSRDAAGRSDDTHGFRLAVDRAFTLAGIGTIVTGSVHAGRIAVGDAVQLARTGQVLRVRSLHAQNRDATEGVAHQRCALNLVGIGRDDLRRGDWITAEGCAATTSRLDASIMLWRDEAAPLATGATVHLHLGAAQTIARVAVLDAERVAPGTSARVQFVLEQPIGAWQHDRIVLRDASATRTIGGGVVLDPGAPVRYRRTPERLALLDALAEPDPARRLARALVAAPAGIQAARWHRESGTEAASALPPSAIALGSGTVRWLLDRTHHDQLRDALLDALLDHHARAPEELGLDAARLRRVAAPRAPEALVARVIEQLLIDGALVRKGAWLHRPEHEVRLSDIDRRIAQRALPSLLDGRFDPPWVRDLARDLRETETAVRQAMTRLARQGDVFQVVRDLYYAAAVIDELALIAREVADDDGDIRAARFRDRTGLGRKRAIQILEFFDRVGFSRRVRDQHLIRPGTTLFTASSAPAS